MREKIINLRSLASKFSDLVNLYITKSEGIIMQSMINKFMTEYEKTLNPRNLLKSITMGILIAEVCDGILYISPL